jgi:diacylglycerol kinase (ATP)
LNAALVIHNARAGAGRAAELQVPLQRWLKEQHPTVPFVACGSIHEARKRLEGAARGTRVVVAGGDGTLHALLPLLIAGGHEVALLPLGSGDDGARALGWGGKDGQAWQRVLQRGLLGPAQAVDVGWVSTEAEERPFFSSLAAGFDAAVAQRALGGPAWLRGQPRYLWATLREVAALRLHTLQVEADGQVLHDGPALFCSSLNGATYGAGMPAVPSARVDDGQLNLLLAGRFNRLQTLAMLPRLLLGWHLGHSRVHSVAFKRLAVSSTTALPLAADGEAMTAAKRLTVRVGLQLLKVVTGPGFKPET